MVDILVLLFLAAMFVGGFARGVMRQLLALAVLGLATYVAGHQYTSLTGLTGRFIHDEAGIQLAAFVIVSGVTSAIGNAIMDAIVFGGRRKRLRREAPPERLAGGVLGVIEGIGALEVGALVLLTFPVLGWDGWIKSSNLIPQFLHQIPFMMPLLPPQFTQALELLP